MKYLESLKAFRERAITPDGQKLTARLRRTVDQFKAVFEDDPSIESGWGHVYFCSRCGTFLTFDPASPHVHRCSCCGHTETAPEYDASWVYLRRYDAVMSALAAAVLYRLDNRQPDLDYFRKVIGFYAERNVPAACVADAHKAVRKALIHDLGKSVEVKFKVALFFYFGDAVAGYLIARGVTVEH